MDLSTAMWIGSAIAALAAGVWLIRGAQRRVRVAPIPIREERPIPRKRR